MPKIVLLISNMFVQAGGDREADWWNRTPETKLTSDFGKRLYALRTKAVASGMRLLSENEVLEEVKRRRGGIDENETDLSHEL